MYVFNRGSIKMKRNHWGNYNVNQWKNYSIWNAIQKNNNNKERRKGEEKRFDTNSEMCESFATVKKLQDPKP